MGSADFMILDICLKHVIKNSGTPCRVKTLFKSIILGEKAMHCKTYGAKKGIAL